MGKPGNVIIYIFLLPNILGRPSLLSNKLSLATWESYNEVDHKGPGTYAFSYDIEDPFSGNTQFRQEERHINGTVIGTYGYVDAYGKPVVVTYIADEKGFRMKIEKEGSPTQYFPNSNIFTKKFFRIPTFSINGINRNNNKYFNYLLNDVKTSST